jgi:hypothetical protein
VKCTDCGRPVKPIVAVDIDGTLAEYHLRLAKFACDYWNIHVPIELWDGRGNYEDYLGMSQAQYREAKLAYRQGGYKRTAPIYPYARDMMKVLYNGFPQVEVWITTTRPWSRLDNVDPDTKFWLERHGIQYDHLLFDDRKYEKLSTIVDPGRVIAVIDDLPEMLEEASQFLPVAHRLLVERPHNRYGGNGVPVSLSHVSGLVWAYIKEWEKRNDGLVNLTLDL